MDKSREQFEEFAQREKLSLAYGDCGYVYTSTEMAWRAWQASRAAIVTELPKGVTTKKALDAGYMGDYAAGVDDGIEGCATAIRAAGLKVKGE
ncbi:hypothetical protein ACI49Z_003454 [Cronobacter turicensis]|nr:hypothetical protein [Cronobacter turicensis]